jgi:hypothetical protein
MVTVLVGLEEVDQAGGREIKLGMEMGLVQNG